MKLLNIPHFGKISSKSFHVLILTTCLINCVPVNQSTPDNSTANFVPKQLVLDDKVYDQAVGGILLYNQNQANPPIIALSAQENLTLEFDIFGSESEYIHAKIIHCDALWNKTNIPDLQVLDEFNEFLVGEFEFSANTTVDYTHYIFQVPKTKISGNYVIAVYRNNNPQDLLFTMRMMVTESIVNVNVDLDVPQQVGRRKDSQELNVALNYENLRTNNPMQELFFTVRQNYRWDNAKVALKPNNEKSNENILEFIPYESETTFYGRNEFRFIDLRTVSLPGFNIERIENTGGRLQATSRTLAPFKGSVYTQPVNEDTNGNFFHLTIEPGTTSLNADYVYTTINLDMGGKVNYPIYLLGAFNFWKSNRENLMTYNPTLGYYQFSKFLKQGIYNFAFETDGKEFPVDKSFRMTGNDYDIIVYQKILGTNYDRIVGYLSTSTNIN